MNQPPTTPPAARAIERNLFGGLLGALASTLVARLLLLAFEVPAIVLAVLLLLGAAVGMFAAHYGSRSPEAVASKFRIWNNYLRQVSLKVMLWMLVLAGLIGVVTVLTASYDTLGRVAGTVIATAIVAGVLWPTSVLADREKTQAAGLLGMVAAVTVYLLVIPQIWELGSSEEEILITSFLIGLTTPFGMLFLAQVSSPSTWIAARVGVGAYVAVVCMFLIAIWHPGGWREREHWAMTAWWSAAYGSLAFASLCGLHRFKLDWRWIGVVTAFLAWTLALLAEWNNEPQAETLLTVISSASVVVAHAALAGLVQLPGKQIGLRRGTIAAVVTSALFVDLEVIFDPQSGLSMLGRISGAAAIVASCGSLALIIFARLNSVANRDHPRTELPEITEITLICPRCQKQQSRPLGRATCDNCRLNIFVSVEEESI